MLVDRRADRETAWLAALLAPVSVDEFLSRYWLKQHLFCRGAAGRFADLISWADINAILEHHWRETFRFRLARQGRDVDPASYADLDGFTPRIRARDLTEHLRRGATLSFDAIDEVHEPLTPLARAFEAFFRGGTKINIYAGWRSLHGLDLHRDNQEIFILHLDGRKRWLLYGRSIDHVDRRDLAGTSIPPAGAVLDEILRPGGRPSSVALHGSVNAGRGLTFDPVSATYCSTRSPSHAASTARRSASLYRRRSSAPPSSGASWPAISWERIRRTIQFTRSLPRGFFTPSVRWSAGSSIGTARW